MGFTDELSSLQPGMTIGDLHIVSFLGKGAIGEVYLAMHEVKNEQFALKVIPKSFGAEQMSEAAKKSAKIQAKLKHPNIINIDDQGEEDMFFWLQMEYTEGEVATDKTQIRSMGDLMRYNKGALTEEEVCYYTYYLLLGLSHAHTQGVVHADLKPANLMMAEDGVKIADFGVTELIGHAWDDFHLLRLKQQLERTPFDPLPGFSRALPALINTFEYYSPEQQAGEKPDHLSNLYSAGLIVYRMLTGRHCLSLDAPSKTTDGINPAWDKWIARALAYKKEDRFQSALTMLEEMPGLEKSEDSTTTESAQQSAG